MGVHCRGSMPQTFDLFMCRLTMLSDEFGIFHTIAIHLLPMMLDLLKAFTTSFIPDLSDYFPLHYLTHLVSFVLFFMKVL